VTLWSERRLSSSKALTRIFALSLAISLILFFTTWVSFSLRTAGAPGLDLETWETTILDQFRSMSLKTYRVVCSTVTCEKVAEARPSAL